jgi:hypothetical protein
MRVGCGNICAISFLGSSGPRVGRGTEYVVDDLDLAGNSLQPNRNGSLFGKLE